MSVHAEPTKFSGSAKATIDYYKDTNEMTEAVSGVVSYYGLEKSDKVFSDVRGKLAQRFELDGLTKEQFARIHGGQDPNSGEQVVRKGMAPVPKRDGQGRPLRVLNREGRLETVYEMVPALTKAGKEIIDTETGLPKLKREMQEAHVAGYNIRLAWDKSVSEALITHRDDPETLAYIQWAAKESADSMMRHVVEGKMRLVGMGKGKPLETADEMMWIVSTGMSARPTVESRTRGYEVDPHFHIDLFVPSMVMKDGKMRKLDGHHLFKQAKTMGQAANIEFNRLLEEHGIEVSYQDATLKGETRTEIAGSNPTARRFFSTNRELVREMTEGFLIAHNRTPTRQEVEEMQRDLRGTKTKAAKIGDKVGNVAKLEEWADSLEHHGIELTIKPRGESLERAPWAERHAELIQRLEAPSGIAQDLQAEAVFGPDAVMPAIYKSAEGLGFSPEELVNIGDNYRDYGLVLVRPANDEGARLYTTKAIIEAEQEVGQKLDDKAKGWGEHVPADRLRMHLAKANVKLNAEQAQLAADITSPRRVVHGVGKAGAGKGVTGRIAVDALREAKAVDRVVVVAAARKRAEETGKDVGANVFSSVVGLTKAKESGRFKPTERTVVLVDEAAMLNVFQMKEILDAAGPAKIVTIGDEKQASPIGAAGWYAKELEKRPATELVEVHRQKNAADKEACELVRDGRAGEAIDNLDARHRLHIADTENEMLVQVRDGWKFYRKAGYDPAEIGIVHQGSNKRIDQLNRMIQHERMKQGELKPDEKLDVREESTGREWTLFEGDRIIVNKGLYGGGLSKPIPNGTMGTVSRIRGNDVRLVLEDEERRHVTIPLMQDAEVQPVSPSYAVSTNKFQGSSVKVGLNVMGNSGNASLNSGYSQMTRAEDVIEVFGDKESFGQDAKQGIKDALSRSQSKTEASEYLRLADEHEEAMYQEQDEMEVQEAVELPIRRQQSRGEDYGHGMSF